MVDGIAQLVRRDFWLVRPSDGGKRSVTSRAHTTPGRSRHRMERPSPPSREPRAPRATTARQDCWRRERVYTAVEDMEAVRGEMGPMPVRQVDCARQLYETAGTDVGAAEPIARIQAAVRASKAVRAHVYHLGSWAERLNTNFGIGAYHVGLEVYGCEYSFGARLHSPQCTGILECPPKQHTDHTFMQTIECGDCPLDFSAALAVVAKMRPRWPGSSYHLLQRNCHTFAEALLGEIGCECSLPSWITMLPSSVSRTLNGMSTFREQAVDLPAAVGALLGRSCLSPEMIATNDEGWKDHVKSEGFQLPCRDESEDTDELVLKAVLCFERSLSSKLCSVSRQIETVPKPVINISNVEDSASSSTIWV